ncbi:MAG: hypothetical protein GX993_02560 [Bacteroidales bacterium]|nr:hypothetical protein [Bacteroidales bacterium]
MGKKESNEELAKDALDYLKKDGKKYIVKQVIRIDGEIYSKFLETNIKDYLNKDN